MVLEIPSSGLAHMHVETKYCGQNYLLCLREATSGYKGDRAEAAACCWTSIAARATTISRQRNWREII